MGMETATQLVMIALTGVNVGLAASQLKMMRDERA